MTGGNQDEFQSPFRTFEAVAKMFGKSAKTVGRWVQTIPGFPQPVRVRWREQQRANLLVKIAQRGVVSEQSVIDLGERSGFGYWKNLSL